MSRRRRIALVLGATLLAVALAANAYAALQSVQALEQGFKNEERPAEVQRTLLSVRSALQGAEGVQRGYLLTGESTYRESFVATWTEVDSLLARLDTLVSWNPIQVARMPGLRASIGDRFREMDELIRLYESEGQAAARTVARANRGSGSFRDIREREAVMQAEAQRVRELYTAQMDQAADRARRSAWASTGALAALLVLLGVGVRRAARRRERYAAGLAEANVSLAESNQAQADANAALSQALGDRETALARVRAMQAQLVQQGKLAGMGRLTAGVAHEIKNPLNFVTNFGALTLELAEEVAEADHRGDHAEVQELAASIQQNASKIVEHGARADAIVQSMLVHARGVTGARRETSMGEVVRAAVIQALGPDGAGRVKIDIQVDPALGTAEVVPESLTRAVQNLVANALHAVRQRDGMGDPTYEPAISVTVRSGENHDGHAAAVVTVADNGAGVPDELFPLIFEPFFTTKGPDSGTGLGLSLAHDIAVGHGGTLLVERPTEGGAAFVLTLPLVAQEDGG